MKLWVSGAKNVNVSIIVFVCYQIETLARAYDISYELFLYLVRYPREVFLHLSVVDIVLLPV